ncbi:MAG: class I SAM-dependent methyltransferase [Spirochaetia bacterium]
MTRDDHLSLLRGAVGPGGGSWADLGSGTGAFTIALAELLGGEGRILSVDRDAKALAEQGRIMRAQFPKLDIVLETADFTSLSGVSGLDGIIMANSLHFQRDAEGVLRMVHTWLASGGCLVVVEYDIELPNPWVPHPVPYSRLARIAGAAGFSPARLLETRPSQYHRRVYSAVMQKR